jgi:S-adenosylmethionine hydrolase
MVQYIDHFENVILNIDRHTFEKISAGRGFQLFFKRRNDPITRLHTFYHEVPEGERVCRFNDSGYLEIAINRGKAASLLGLRIQDAVQIQFES